MQSDFAMIQLIHFPRGMAVSHSKSICDHNSKCGPYPGANELNFGKRLAVVIG